MIELVILEVTIRKGHAKDDVAEAVENMPQSLSALRAGWMADWMGEVQKHSAGGVRG